MYERKARFAALADAILAADPDFVCIQEATLWFKAQWLAHPELSARYLGSWPPNDHFAWYFTVTFVRLAVPELDGPGVDLPVDVVRMAYPPADTEQGRDLLYVRLGPPDGHGLVVGNVHMESAVNAGSDHKRLLQGRALIDRLSTFVAAGDDVWLMGDTNECAELDPADSALNAAFRDVSLDTWSTLHSGDPGWTEDTDINIMRALFRPTAKHARLDRILLFQPSRFAPASIDRLGTIPFAHHASTNHPIFISDHFGLHATYSASAAPS
ncbi:endonuclease/Exonuclease/phosphatase [Thecamonas trahens ATCC 50062]|uniref:Endonuclease/Exonuclease/phosphatase n=1 Tax=Thecamonas trahens ATCC 50062 TaxID=461836 RepID=A0A0L0DCZ4_THETB|nr:endonuclease/Exonuclease/phosphatase [Thecamonas trahens ATCC 50062]KNC49198.1 endonuclease/Exonuclease/phosphatase [Thecamonas trahens ATCC 50062]|eukprot:XP_013758214.1 endonuclease/Exonuclease/phosphatase [Thecamonas trahens ATCC 50062]